MQVVRIQNKAQETRTHCLVQKAVQKAKTFAYKVVQKVHKMLLPVHLCNERAILSIGWPENLPLRTAGRAANLPEQCVFRCWKTAKNTIQILLYL